jgi:hypothetical protein
MGYRLVIVALVIFFVALLGVANIDVIHPPAVGLPRDRP